MITIGLTLDHPDPQGTTPQVSQDRAYITAITRARAAPLVMAPLSDHDALRRLYDLCDALCLPGGWDVNPHLYGEPAKPATRGIDDLVEATEVQLLRWALADDKPVLGVCRGMQLLNVVLGGSLTQDLTPHTNDVNHKPGGLLDLIHDVTIEPGSILAACAGTETLRVNSSHHQAINRLGKGVRVTATASDGVIEAIDVPAYRFLTGVQFHPEVLVTEHPWAARLFLALTESAISSVGEPA